jgi:hypothetical protein
MEMSMDSKMRDRVEAVIWGTGEIEARTALNLPDEEAELLVLICRAFGDEEVLFVRKKIDQYMTRKIKEYLEINT